MRHPRVGLSGLGAGSGCTRAVTVVDAVVGVGRRSQLGLDLLDPLQPGFGGTQAV